MQTSRRSGIIRVPLALAGLGIALGFLNADPRERDPAPPPEAGAGDLEAAPAPLPPFPRLAPLPPPDRLPAPVDPPAPESGAFPSLRDYPGLLDALARPSRAFPLDIANSILGVPEILLDGAASVLETVQPEQDGSTWARLLSIQPAAPRPGLAERFFELAMDREQRFFASLADSDPSEFDTAEGGGDERYLRQKQRKIVFEALRRTYTEKYRLSADDRIRDEALRVDAWSGLDFVVLPPLLAGYVYYRGIDKRFSVGSTWVRLSVESVSDILHDDEARCALNLMWVPKDFPVGLIVSVGFDEGEAGLDFVGIGTSVDIVRKALGQSEDHGIRAR